MLSHDIFSTLAYLESRVGKQTNVQILAVVPNPHEESVRLVSLPNFKFLGYELIDVGTQIDPLLNCSDFVTIIQPDDFTEEGLLKSYERGTYYQKELLAKFPDHVHSDTVLFAVWIKKN